MRPADPLVVIASSGPIGSDLIGVGFHEPDVFRVGPRP